MLNTFPTPLILVDSSVAVPTASREVARLTDRDRLLAAFNAPTAFTLFHEAVLGAHGIDPRQSSSTRPPSELAYSAIAATSTSLSTLLAAVATPLAERSCHRVSAGLVCQSTLDEAVSQSQACWMAGLVGTDCTVLGVAAGQAATLHAIEMGAALMQDSDEPSIALLVAAERWLAPYPRTIDGFSVRGDAAAGVSITNDPEAQGWQLTGIVTESPSRAHDHVETVDREANPIIEYWGVDEIQRQAMVNRLTRAIRRLFDATNLTPAEITVVIPPAVAPLMTEAVVNTFGWSGRLLDTKGRQRGDLAAAEPLYLMDALRHCSATPGDKAILWTLDPGGVAGAIAFEYHAPDEGEPDRIS